jgi:hypothetical protein
MSHPYRTAALVFTAIVTLTGCSTGQTFHLVLTILNKTDGQPVSGAKVVLDKQGVEERKQDVDYGQHEHNVKVDENGAITFDFLVSPYPPDPGRQWFLKVSKDGFEPVVIDIKPSPLPSRADEILPLIVTVEMQKKAAPPPKQDVKK